MVRQMPIKTGCEMISSHSGIVTEATSTLSNQQKVTSNEQKVTNKEQRAKSSASIFVRESVG